jgi:tRNA (guanine-N7-)-methyltransferase
MQDPLIPLSEYSGHLPQQAIFGRAAPLEVEVGTGKGHTMVSLATAAPDTDFLGIEVGSKYSRLARVKLIRAAIPNARLVTGEAQWVLQRYLPPGSVRCFHIYFPDPWPKKRHAKRRLFRPGIGELLAGRLEPGGRVRIATDHEAYFRQIVELMTAAGFQPDHRACWPETPVSAFEAKYRVQGRAIYRAVFCPPGG